MEVRDRSSCCRCLEEDNETTTMQVNRGLTTASFVDSLIAKGRLGCDCTTAVTADDDDDDAPSMGHSSLSVSTSAWI